MQSKINKYFYKFKNSINIGSPNIFYMRKLAEYITNCQIGGNIIEISKKENGTIDENIIGLFNFIKEATFDKIPTKKQKYCAIIMGPAGTGKSLAKKIATKFIFDNFENKNNTPTSSIEYEAFFNTFVDVTSDDYVYGLKLNNNETGQQILKSTLNEYLNKDEFKDKNMDDLIDIFYKDPRLYGDLVKNTTSMYNDLKKHVDPLKIMMIHIASYFGLNIFFEIIGNTSTYISTIIVNDFCRWEMYTPIVVFPYISDIELHKKRIIMRGLTEGRFMSISSLYETRQNTSSAFDSMYDGLKSSLKSTSKNVGFLKYNNDKTITKEMIEGYDFKDVVVVKSKVDIDGNNKVVTGI